MVNNLLFNNLIGEYLILVNADLIFFVWIKRNATTELGFFQIQNQELLFDT